MKNRLGWILAIGVVAAATVAGYFAFSPSPTPPTPQTTAPGALDLRTVEIPFQRLGLPIPSADGNAGDDYFAAIALLRANPALTRPAASRPSTESADDTPALEEIDRLVAAGAKKRDMRYVLVHEPKELAVSYYTPAADDFSALAFALEKLAARCATAGKTAQAREVLGHELTMGNHLVQERSLPAMSIRGIQIEQAAMARTAALLTSRDADAMAAMRECLASMEDFLDAAGAKAAVVWNPRPHPGDVCRIAEFDADRSWRVQAILSLGVVRHTAERDVDARRAMEIIRRYAQSADPLESSAAKAAEIISAMQVRSLGAPRPQD